MILIQVLLLLTNVFSIKLFTKVIHTPIYDLNQISALHHIILLKTTEFDVNQREYDDIYAIDFSPIVDITDWKIACKIFLGKKVQGKIRLVYFDKISDKELFRESLDKYPMQTIESIKNIDSELYYKILNWDPVFQLYNRNCQHFGRYMGS